MTNELANVPFKLQAVARYWAGDWTAEQIDAGEAGDPVEVIDTGGTWYEPGPDGPVEVTDPERIAELEAQAAIAAGRQ